MQFEMQIKAKTAQIISMMHVVSCPTLLPVQPPEVDTFTLPLPHHNSQPVGDKLCNASVGGKY